MNIKNRMLKLEQIRTPILQPILIIHFEEKLTVEQQHRIDKAKKGQIIMHIRFVGPEKKLTKYALD